MVVRHGHVVAEGWAHPFGPERPHATFSVGKSLTATAVAIAAGEGLLDVDDLLLDHVGDAAPRDPSVHLRAMRLRHLLTMTTGHHDDPSERVRSGDDWLGAFLAEPVAHEPGTWWVYNLSLIHI